MESAISLFQHPSFASEGIGRIIIILGGQTNLKRVRHLPGFYADVPPVSSDNQKIYLYLHVPASSLVHVGDFETTLKTSTNGYRDQEDSGRSPTSSYV